MLEFFSVPVLTTYTIQIIKDLLRQFVLKDPAHDFSPAFYRGALPLVTLAYSVLFGYLGLGERATVDMDVVMYSVLFLLEWFVQVILSVAFYHTAVKPSVEYNQTF